VEGWGSLNDVFGDVSGISRNARRFGEPSYTLRPA